MSEAPSAMPSAAVSTRVTELAADIENRKAQIAKLEREAADAKRLLASSQAAFNSLMQG